MYNNGENMKMKCDFCPSKSTFTSLLENLGFVCKSIILPRDKCEFVIKNYRMSVIIIMTLILLLS